LARFWAKVDIGANDECWNWTACTTGAKTLGWYGRFKLRGRCFYAHRMAFCIARGYPVDYLSDKVCAMHTPVTIQYAATPATL